MRKLKFRIIKKKIFKKKILLYPEGYNQYFRIFSCKKCLDIAKRVKIRDFVDITGTTDNDLFYDIDDIKIINKNKQ